MFRRENNGKEVGLFVQNFALAAVVSEAEATERVSGDDAKLVGGVKPRLGGSGSAWKAGALSDASQILQVERTQVVERILSGRHELRIDPSQIVDVIGSDRREDWRDQDAVERLKESITKNGQDTHTTQTVSAFRQVSLTSISRQV